MATRGYEYGPAPAAGPRFGKTPSGNPLPRRGQVKERIAKDVALALATAAALACGDRPVTGAGKKAGAAKPPAAAPGGMKK